MQRYLYNLATDKSRGLVAWLLKFFLFILSLVYGVIIRVLVFLKKLSKEKFDVKVVSVGNITLGGTGKTILVEYIASYLKENGKKVAVISRGYKRKAQGFEPAAIDYESMGDEPYMLSKKLNGVPVIVDANRGRAIKKAQNNFGADTVVLDDGFQQCKINKDVEIVAIDATNPFGNRHVLPRGILREPLSSLRRADVFVLTKTDLAAGTGGIKEYLSGFCPGTLVAEAIHEPLGFYTLNDPGRVLEADVLKGKSAALFSGIGDPDSFESLIKKSGIKVALSFRFPDHHDYSDKDMNQIISASRSNNVDCIITTEKDAVRLSGTQHCASCELQILVLRVSLKFTKEEDKFRDRLLKLYSV